MNNLKFFILLNLLSYLSYGQQVNFTKTPALGVHLVFFDFKGADKGTHFGRDMKPGLALHFQNSFSRQVDYSITLAGSFIEFPDGKGGSLGNGKKQLLLENDFAVRARLVKSPALFNPYLLTGLGWSQYDNQYGLYAPVGLGLQVNVTQDLFLLVNSQYRIPVSSLQHQHFFHSIGIAGAISRKKIVHATTAPLPPPVVKQAMPTDVDGDGILDQLDSCPHIAGVMRYHGCPAPDRDGDGIFDEEDECPRVKGVAAYKGCPMPDKDPDVDSIMNWAAQHIFFETGSFHLLPRSFPSLDSIAILLNKIPGLQLTIEGHTDNIGTRAENQLLSEHRASAVMDYIIRAGIDIDRLKCEGFGQERPIATNTTAEGRAKNRRVELSVF